MRSAAAAGAPAADGRGFSGTGVTEPGVAGLASGWVSALWEGGAGFGFLGDAEADVMDDEESWRRPRILGSMKMAAIMSMAAAKGRM